MDGETLVTLQSRWVHWGWAGCDFRDDSVSSRQERVEWYTWWVCSSWDLSSLPGGQWCTENPQPLLEQHWEWGSTGPGRSSQSQQHFGSPGHQQQPDQQWGSQEALQGPWSQWKTRSPEGKTKPRQDFFIYFFIYNFHCLTRAMPQHYLEVLVVLSPRSIIKSWNKKAKIAS